ncbi:MAG: DUF882 domain-containing protein, partial [Candidatus Competibacteraceae bacterium]|nr:DUF882 domain-containing protein [Candidatus Competibacteraceae bacterium]
MPVTRRIWVAPKRITPANKRINSGYRTAETNANTEGAVIHSQHLTGKAVDLAVDGIPSDGAGKTG